MSICTVAQIKWNIYNLHNHLLNCGFVSVDSFFHKIRLLYMKISRISRTFKKFLTRVWGWLAVSPLFSTLFGYVTIPLVEIRVGRDMI